MNIYSIDADMLCPSDEDGLIAPYETKVVCLSDHAAALQAEREKHAAEVNEKDAEIERMKKDNSGLHEIQDLQREHIVERDRRIAGLEKELAEARALADQQYQFALQTVKDNEALKAALEEERVQGNTMRDLLDRTATALHGGKWPGLNSWHDLPDRAAKMRAALVPFSNHHKEGLLKHVGMSCFKAAHDALEGQNREY